MLTKEAIAGAKDMPVTVVPVPEWGGEIGVRCLTGAERDSLEKLMRARGDDDTTQTRAILVAMSACDADGNNLFTTSDVAMLQKKNAVALDRIFKASAKLNLITSQSVEAEAKN